MIIFILLILTDIDVVDTTETTNVCTEANGNGDCFEVPKFPNVSIDDCRCWLHGFDLCADFLFNTKLNIDSNATILQLEGYIVGSKDVRILLEYLLRYSNCKPVPTENGTKDIALIDMCPSEFDFNPDFKLLCETSTNGDLLPTDYFMVTFQNVYCAFCHGLPESEGFETLYPWTISMHCTNISEYKWKDIEVGINKGTCQPVFDQPQTTVVYSLNKTDILDNGCRNCLPNFQNSDDYSSDEACVLCRFSLLLVSAGIDNINITPPGVPFHVLFELPKEPEVNIKINGELFKASDICLDNENFDILFQRYREFVCPFGQYAKLGVCHDNETMFLPAISQPLPTASDTIFITFPQQLFDSLFLEIVKLDNIIVNITYGVNYESIKLVLNSTGMLVTDLLEQVGNMEMYLNGFSMLRVTNYHDNTTLHLLCQQGSFDCFNESDVYFVKETMYAKVYDVEQNRTRMYPVDNILFDMTIDPIESIFTFTKICVCASPEVDDVLKCTFPLRKYNAEEYIIDDGTLKILGYGMEFNQSEFYIKDGTAFVCYDPNETHSFFDLNNVQQYVSWVCSGISIFCLILTVIVYAHVPKLCKLPGKLTIGVSVSLIFGHGMLFSPYLGVHVCKYIAALTHCSWLSAFLWISSQAINMLITFHDKFIACPESAFKKYLLVCLLLPISIVTVCFTMDAIPGDHIHVKYGLTSCSWMADTNGYIFAFFVPVGLSQATNIVCFALTLYSIEKSVSMSENVVSRLRDKRRCLMYVKLSSIMGFTWMFGFLASFLNIGLLWYGFILLNGLQGVFILFSFCFNTNVRQFLAGRISTTRFGILCLPKAKAQTRPTSKSIVGNRS